MTRNAAARDGAAEASDALGANAMEDEPPFDELSGAVALVRELHVLGLGLGLEARLGLGLWFGLG